MYKSELGFHIQTKNQFQIDFCVYIVIVRGLIDEFSFDESSGISSEALGEQILIYSGSSHSEVNSSILIFHHNLLVLKILRIRLQSKIKGAVNIVVLIYYMINVIWILKMDLYFLKDIKLFIWFNLFTLTFYFTII